MKAKIRLILTLTVLCTFNGLGQKHKIGYINVQELWSLMPEKQSADSVLTQYTAELNAYYTGMVENFNAKSKALTSDANTDKNSLLYQEKLREVQELKTKMEDFKAKAEKDIQVRRDSLYSPIKKKMQAAIDTVADKNGFDYILDAGFGNIVYRRTEDNNIINLVKKELKLE